MRTPRLLTMIVGSFVALSLLAACGESPEPLDATGVEPAVKVESGLVPDAAPMIDQNDLKFSPRELTIRSGDTIYVRNDETAIHAVTINGVNVTGDMSRDEVFAWTISRPGIYKFTCDYHPQMKATITVE